MGVVIPARILGLEGQVIKKVLFDEEAGRVRIVCDRDRRWRPVDHRTGRTGSVNRLLRRTVLDVPPGGWPCEIEIEYAESQGIPSLRDVTFLSPGQVRVERLPFVSPKVRVTRRYARLIAGMARHMPISTVARHTGLSWDSVKAIECAHLDETIPIPDPKHLEGIRYLGVNEVARAKGQSYFTHRPAATPRQRLPRHGIFQTQDIPDEHQGHAVIPLQPRVTTDVVNTLVFRRKTVKSQTLHPAVP